MSGANISSKLRKLTLCRDELDDEAGDEEQSQHLCHWIRNVSLGHWRLSFLLKIGNSRRFARNTQCWSHGCWVAVTHRFGATRSTTQRLGVQ